MKIRFSHAKVHASAAAALVVFALLLFVPPAKSQSAVTIISPSKQNPVQQNLVSDIPGLAVTTDPNLINPWGISNSPTSPYWISDQGTGKATLYNGLGVPTALVVPIPAIGIPSGPTGTVFNASTTSFLVGATAANFIFATLDGTIAARATGALAVTEATVPGAIFTGLALANNGTANFLYAANFVSGGTINVFDSTFTSTTLAGSFTDPSLPIGYGPYNIQLLNGNLYVAYAQVGSRGATIGAGLGIVDVFTTNGTFVSRLISNGGALNAPWGLTIAPAGFMTFGGDLLVGNFGNGEINAFDPVAGTLLGTLSNSEGRPIANPGLWAIEFGNGNAGSSSTTLYFNAGINGEQDGLFGAITPGPLTLMFLGQLVGAPSAPQAITVENTGNASMTLTAAPTLSATTEFAIATGTTCTNALVIPAGGTCIINVTFTPGAAGARGPVTLTISDTAPGLTQTVVVTGTGTAGTPSVTLSPSTPLTFAGQLVSTTSAGQTVTVTNSGTAPLIFGAGAVTVSNDFSQTNTCSGATVAVGLTCTVTVSFAPSSTLNNPRTGTLSIANNATGSPQTVALSGTAWDFTVTAPATASATPGTPSNITVTIGALGGFTGAVTLTCSGTIPQGSCVAPTTPVTAPGTATITFTTAAHVVPPPSLRMPQGPTRQIVLVLSFLGLLFVLFTTRQTRTRLGLAGAILVLTLMAGCGTSSTTGTSTGTPAGSYPITVTGTSGGASRTATVTLTVT